MRANKKDIQFIGEVIPNKHKRPATIPILASRLYYLMFIVCTQ